LKAVGGEYGLGACSQTQRKNRVGEITDETKLIVFLSTPESEQWEGDILFHFIRDIVRYVDIINVSLPFLL
jgi:hypothetical protein